MNKFKVHYVKSGTKLQEKLVNDHKQAVCTNLNQCYLTFSEKKRVAFQLCEMERLKLKGYDMRINSFSRYAFTWSFLCNDINTDNIMLYTITPKKYYICYY